MSSDFLVYEVYGNMMFYLPAAALCAYVGWKLTKAVLEPRGFERRTIKLVTIPVSIALFLLLASFMESY